MGVRGAWLLQSLLVYQGIDSVEGETNMFVSRDLPTSTYITLSLQWENTTMWSRFREVVKIPFLLMRLVVTGKAQFGEFTMPATLGKSEPLDNAESEGLL